MKTCHGLTHTKEVIKTGQENFWQAKQYRTRASDVVCLSDVGLQPTASFKVGGETDV